MRPWKRATGRMSVSFVLGCLLLMHLSGAAVAQNAAGWYGPYDDGCDHWWDGYQWTTAVDCDGDGYTDASVDSYPANWYGPYDDGCMHWWDGYQWTVYVDCDRDGLADAGTVTYPAGWYGPFDDGCNYWWNGSLYSGEYDCNGDGLTDATNETYPPDWYDLYGDGCRYWFNGTVYTGDVDCNGDRTADSKQEPTSIDTSSTGSFVDTQVAAINQMWAGRFSSESRAYTDTHLVVASEPIAIGCVTQDGDQVLETEDWIFYCAADNAIYVGPGNLERVELSGVGAVQFMVAHEIGHHVQDLLDASFSTDYAADTVKYENQATCMAGVWFYELDAEGTPSDINAAMTYLSTATDDVHGSAQDQIDALLKGYHDPNSC